MSVARSIRCLVLFHHHHHLPLSPGLCTILTDNFSWEKVDLYDGNCLMLADDEGNTLDEVKKPVREVGEMLEELFRAGKSVCESLVFL